MLPFWPVPAKICCVTLTDVRGVKHAADVTAESVFEAAALALAAMRRSAWLDAPGRAGRLEVAVYEPVVKHTLTVEQVERWLNRATSSPNEKVKKDRLKTLLAGSSFAVPVVSPVVCSSPVLRY